MEVASLDKFLINLSNSELLTPESLAEARKAAESAADAKSFAVGLVKHNLLTAWQAGQLLIGRTSFLVGRYRLIQHLGRGGMGSVFLAEHVTMNRRVALKMLSRSLDKDPTALERFFAEARAVASLDHPNIVQAYSADNADDRYYMVMEYVDGRDLDRIVEEKGPLDYAEAAEIIRQAAEGLAHAHAKGMVHRDIKPANLLINKQGTVKILDLGLARLSGDQAASDEHKVLGTIDYMAPEQGLQSDTFDQRADIYSLGCTLYFLLTGRAPFPDGSLAQRIVKHQTEEPASILEKRPDAPKTLVKICRKMMAKDPAQRYQSANEVVKALTEWNPQHRELKRAVPLEEEPPSDDPLAEIAAMEFAQRAAASTHVRIATTKTRSPASRRAEDRKRWLIIGGAIGSVVLMAIAVVVVLATTSGGKPRPIPAGDAPKHATKKIQQEKKKVEEDEKEMYRKRWPGIDFSDESSKPKGGFQGPDAKVAPADKKPSDKSKGTKK